jgi:hypothetical protein
MSRSSTQFKKGMPRPPNAGRKKGSRNLLTKASRELVLLAAADGKGDEGALAYLKDLRRRKPSLFAMMFAKTIDTRMKGEADVRETVRLVDLTGLNLADPAVRRRLGPEILGRWPGDEKKT